MVTPAAKSTEATDVANGKPLPATFGRPGCMPRATLLTS
jgi:hypothetical protein